MEVTAPSSVSGSRKGMRVYSGISCIDTHVLIAAVWNLDDSMLVHREDMNRTARTAGVTFLLYIATTVADTFLFARVSRGSDMAARLASIAHHVAGMQFVIALSILKILYALILAVTLYALTRAVDRDLALLAFACRVVEGVLNAVPATVRFGLLSIAVTSTGSAAADATRQQAQAALLLNFSGWSGSVNGAIFAVGSALFAYLFLRGRSIPTPLAWLGIVGSLLILPLFILAGLRLASPALAWLISIPILLFEVTFAFWLIVKGVHPQTTGERK
jgi:hypothetical protein